MRLTKFGHSCVRISHDGVTVLLDPGVWTGREAVEGVDAVLITHEHPDHYLADHLRATEAPIYTIDAVAAKIRAEAPDLVERLTVVGPGQRFGVGPQGSLEVQAVGELHAVIHPELPRFDNSGFLLHCGDQRVFHPGDALTGPEVPVDVLLAPVCAPWLKTSEAVDFARSVGAARNVAIHDKVYSEQGLGIVDGHMRLFLDKLELEYVRLAEGADL